MKAIKRITFLLIGVFVLLGMNKGFYGEKVFAAPYNRFVYMHLNEGELTGDNILDNGDGNYIFSFSIYDEGKALPTPMGVDREFLGWIILGDDVYYSQITSSIDEKSLIGVFEGDELEIIQPPKTQINKPTADSRYFEYTGERQTFKVEGSAYYTVTNNVHTEAGRYTVCVALSDRINYEWNDGTTLDLLFDFEIHDFNIEWIWSNNNLSAKAIINCKNDDCNENAELTATVITGTNVRPTATSYGEDFCTAKVTYKGIERTNTKLIITPKLKTTLSNDDGSITVYNSNGFSKTSLMVTDATKSEQTVIDGLNDYEVLKSCDIQLENITTTDKEYDIKFDLSKYVNQYSDFAIVFIDSENNAVVVGERLVNNTISIEHKLGKFQIVGIGSTANYKNEFSAVITIEVVMLTMLIISLGLVSLKIVSISFTKRALKNF